MPWTPPLCPALYNGVINAISLACLHDCAKYPMEQQLDLVLSLFWSKLIIRQLDGFYLLNKDRCMKGSAYRDVGQQKLVVRPKFKSHLDHHHLQSLREAGPAFKAAQCVLCR